MWGLLLKAAPSGPLSKDGQIPRSCHASMDGLPADNGFLHLHEYARCSSALLVFLRHETPRLQAFGEEVECFRLL